MFFYTGDYIEHTTDDIYRSTYYTFTPRTLLDGDFYTLDEELVRLLTEAHRALGVLQGMISENRCSEEIKQAIQLKEACFTKMIDDSEFDIRSFICGEGNAVSDESIKNIFLAYECVTKQKGRKINYDDIFSHAYHGQEAKRAFFTRRKPLFLKHATANYRQYNPTAPMQITKALSGIQEYLTESKADVLIKVALCHYQFEMIHPFECYNGIVGRALNSKILIDAGLGCIPYLSLSHALFQHKAEYFEKLGVAQKNGDYRSWMEFFISTILDAARNGIQFITEFNQFTAKDEAEILNRQNRQDDHTLEVYRYFRNVIAADTRQVCNALSFSFKSTARAIEILKEVGVLEQITKGSRNRKFAHRAMLHLITM